MRLPRYPDYIPETTGELHEEIKLRNINTMISIIASYPEIFGNSIEYALTKLRAERGLTEFNEFAPCDGMTIEMVECLNKFNELHFLDVDFLATPVV